MLVGALKAVDVGAVGTVPATPVVVLVVPFCCEVWLPVVCWVVAPGEVVPFVVIVPVEVPGMVVPGATVGGTVQASVPLPLPNVGRDPLGHCSVTVVAVWPGEVVPVTSCEFPVSPVELEVATVGSGVVVT